MSHKITARHQYVDGPSGQLHYTVWGEANSSKPVLLCLAPSPFSAVAYYEIAPHLTSKYRVVAMDYPGFGNSARAEDAPTIQTFAQAVLSVANALNAGQPIDLLGFHTGCLVAIDSAVQNPDLFRRLILLDVPFFTPEQQADLLSKNLGQITLTDDMSCLQPVWDSCITKRLKTVDMDRAFQIFLDQVSLGEQGGAAFTAAFQYDCMAQGKKLTTPTTVIATKAGLYEQSLAAYNAISNADIIEALDITMSVLDRSAPQTAQYILKAVA